MVVGIDISSKMLEKAEGKLDVGNNNQHLVRADAQMLGFADNSFDSVVTSCTFLFCSGTGNRAERTSESLEARRKAPDVRTCEEQYFLDGPDDGYHVPSFTQIWSGAEQENKGECYKGRVQSYT